MSEHPVWRYDNQMPAGREFAIFHSSNTTAQPMVYHSHHYYEIYFILRGSIHVIAEEMDLTPALGDALIYPPHCMHRVVHTDPSQPYERFYLYLTKEFLSSISTEDYNFIAELDKLTADGQRCVQPGEQAVLSLLIFLPQLRGGQHQVQKAAAGRRKAQQQIAGNPPLPKDEEQQEAEGRRQHGKGSVFRP